MPNRAIEFHDSTLDSVTWLGNTVVVYFSAAYIHQSMGKPGWDAGSGWVQPARLHIATATSSGTIPEFPCDLWHGKLHLDGKLYQLLPIPLKYEGEVQLDLEYNGKLQILGKRIELELIGDPTYVEEVPGDTKK